LNFRQRRLSLKIDLDESDSPKTKEAKKAERKYGEKIAIFYNLYTLCKVNPGD